MARLARIVVPGQPHLVTQRSLSGQRAFFSDADHELYLSLLADNCKAAEVEIAAYVLMPDHVHLVLVPRDAEGLRKALSTAHRRYAALIHQRRKRTGSFWQGRFSAVAMDKEHASFAIAYALSNPVRTKHVKRAADWRWSSAKAHLKGKADALLNTPRAMEYAPDLGELLKLPQDHEVFGKLRKSQSIGRPAGSLAFLKQLEKKLKRTLIPQKRGPKPQ